MTVWDSENLSVNRDPFNRAGQRKAHRSTRVRFASFRARVTECPYGMSPPIFGYARRGGKRNLGVSARGSTQKRTRAPSLVPDFTRCYIRCERERETRRVS